jgi:5-methyltetrahydropteroyltriglutamate--homocysteine methyltransferase
MKQSTDRILTTHVGSLGRPHALLDIMREREHDRPYDKKALNDEITKAVADLVQKQVDNGIDIVADGEMSKVSFLGYVKDRMGGYELDNGPSRLAPTWQAEVDMFPEYYEGYFKKYSSAISPLRRIVCKGPITYVGQELLAIDIANLKAATKGKRKVLDIFMPSSGPSGFGTNQYYSSHEEYLHAVGEAMREEYLAIVDAGFVLQVDDPWLIDMLADPKVALKDRRKAGQMHIEVINHALRGIPKDRVRHHTCYGLNHGPRLTDIPLRDALKFTFKINAGAFSFEVMNPRHMHEWTHAAEIGVPDDAILIPGLIGHANNYVEHPELIAEYIMNYASIVGRERVIAGTDCGFSSRASYAPEVHPTVVWPKFKALAQGAAIASKKLWATKSGTKKAAASKPVAAKPAAKKAAAAKPAAKKAAVTKSTAKKSTAKKAAKKK